jgi:predicted hydrolase (HD superfamily)
MYDRQAFAEAVKAELEPNIYCHSLALEACMAGLYDYFSAAGQLTADDEPREDWTLAGLIHDIDYAGEWKEAHLTKTVEALAKHGLEVSESVLTIVRAHGPHISGVTPQTKAQWAIFCADSLTGLITAVALINPSKKLADVKLSSVVKRFLKEPKFAAGTRRDEVAQCSRPDGLNLPLEQFIGICLTSMQGISDELGL